MNGSWEQTVGSATPVERHMKLSGDSDGISVGNDDGRAVGEDVDGAGVGDGDGSLVLGLPVGVDVRAQLAPHRIGQIARVNV